ncbi:uncharacterized protein FOBCDRAFT_245875 [Fusarium oxysporum Fo47]|uniref:uncharacterized protein n=1 Tax=Fusarium oxysporum Fo47 TaxID=660027 RepID=UPI002869AA66|nr:uncharacterized protein FOBCDRAFT_245875 [Fusarium oxysporum Fo47]QKD62570.2 hypothetical protein FOBCDRAFT_245875 [Fusarium oxysporum Fo47]
MCKITGSSDAQRKYNGIFLEDLVKHSNHRMVKWLAHGRHSQSTLNTDEASLSRLVSSIGIVRDQLSRAHCIVLKRKLLSSLTNTPNGPVKSGRATVRDFLEGGGAVGAESLNDVSGQYNAVRDVKLSQEGNSEVIVIDDDDDDDDQDFMDWEGNDAPGQSPAPCREQQQTQTQPRLRPQPQQFNHHSLTPPFSNTPQSAIPADDSMLLDPMIPLEVQAFRNETQKIATKLANDRRDFQAQFVSMRVSRKWRAMIQAVRNIALGEPVTVDYGAEYWEGRAISYWDTLGLDLANSFGAKLDGLWNWQRPLRRFHQYQVDKALADSIIPHHFQRGTPCAA